MDILIAEDDAISKSLLEKILKNWGHNVYAANDGQEAWVLLQQHPEVKMVITDWMMPNMSGLELCGNIRRTSRDGYVYVILLTALARKEELIQGFEAGADDYVTKPFDRPELSMRIKVGERIVALERELAARVEELEESLTHIKKLEGLLPICSHCKKIRETNGDAGKPQQWRGLEEYISQRSDAQFTHSICPECLEKYYPKG